MSKNYKNKLLTLTMLLLTSCLFELPTDETEFEQQNINDKIKQGKTTICDSTNKLSYREYAVYRDDQYRTYQVYVDYENYDLYQKDHKIYEEKGIPILDAYKIAEHAALEIEVFEKFDYKKIAKHSVIDAYKELQTFHVIFTQTDEEFAILLNDYEEDPKKYLAYITLSKFCWDNVKDSNLTIVIRSVASNYSVLTHEFGHLFAYIISNNSDHDHIDPLIWIPISGEDSFNGKVLYEYELKHNINVYGGGPVPTTVEN